MCADTPKLGHDPISKKPVTKRMLKVNVGEEAWRLHPGSPTPRNMFRPSTKPGHVPVSEIRPSEENDQIYGKIDTARHDFSSLVDSIEKFGIQEPILISRDGYIISGHRRFKAAEVAGLEDVPCRVHDVVKKDVSSNQWMTILQLHNEQRVKTTRQRVCEEIVKANPDDTYSKLIHARFERGKIDVETIEIREGTAGRSKISAAKMQFLAAIKHVMDERRDYWPLTDRMIHYALLNNPPLRHASKPDSTYRNDSASYKSLVELLTRARLQRWIPMEAIADETRPQSSWPVCDDVGEFVKRELDLFLQYYWRNLLQSQTNHVEVVVEKNTVAGIIEPICKEFVLPMTSGRGYCSLRPRYDIVQRYRKSGKTRLVVIIVSDFDPDGEAIAESFARSLRNDFGCFALHAVKAGLTYGQTKEYMLPVGGKAKPGSSNYQRFVEQYGSDVYELEALPPQTLQRVVRETILSVLEVDKLNEEIEQEKKDSADIDLIRRRGLRALQEIAAELGHVPEPESDTNGGDQ